MKDFVDKSVHTILMYPIHMFKVISIAKLHNFELHVSQDFHSIVTGEYVSI
uniref:Uncharacterized protein n=1 Tax=Arundo donax TaxID=35708 RepID=A0A0A8ZIJ0_ARUDO